MPVPGWDVPGNYYDPDVEEPESKMTTRNPTYLDRLLAEVKCNATKQDREPVTDSSLTYGDLRIMLDLLQMAGDLSEKDGPFSDEDKAAIDRAWEQHRRTTRMKIKRAELGVDGNCGFALLGEDIVVGEAEFEEIKLSDDAPIWSAEGRRQTKLAINRAYQRLKARIGRPISYFIGPSHPDFLP